MPEDLNAPNNTVTLWPLPEIKHVYLLAAGIVLGVLLGPAVMGSVFPKPYEQWLGGGGDNAQLQQAYDEANLLTQQPQTYLLPPEIEADIARYEALAYDALEKRLDVLRSTGVSGEALTEERANSESAILEHRDQVTQRAFEARRMQLLLTIAGLEREMTSDRHARLLRLIGVQMALVLALVAFAIAEALLAPPVGGDGRRVASPRLAHLVTIRYALLAGWLTLTIAQPAALKQVNPVFAGVLVVVVLVVGFVPLGKRAKTGTA